MNTLGISRKIERPGKEIQDMKNQMLILELKNTITERKRLAGWAQC